MTSAQLKIIEGFKGVVFPAWSRRKRFAENMIAAAAADPAQHLTRKQHHYLTLLAFQFRRQMPADVGQTLVEMAADAIFEPFRVKPETERARRRENQGELFNTRGQK